MDALHNIYESSNISTLLQKQKNERNFDTDNSFL